MRYLIPVLAILLALQACDPDPKDGTNNDGQTLQRDTLLDRLNASILNKPNDPELYHERALHFKELGNFTAALNDLDRAMRADSTKGQYFLTRGQIHWQNQAFKDAYNDYLKCIELEPLNEDCLLEAANMEIVLKNYNEAITHINTALRQNDYISQAYYMKGRIYKETGDTALAVSSYQTATEIDPEYYDAFIQLGLLYASAGHDLADEYYTSAQTIKPNSVEALYDHAIFLQETGFKDPTRYDRANDLYDKILAIQPDYSAAYFNKGYIQLEYLSADDESAYERGVEFFSKAIEYYPLYYQAHYNRGLCYESMGMNEEASRDYRKALSIEPTYTPAAIALERALSN